MKRVLLALAASLLALPALAQTPQRAGPLGIQNALGEIAANGTQATARANLGLGLMATQNPASVAITGGSIAGLSSLGVTGNATVGGTLGITGAVNTTSASGYQIGGVTALGPVPGGAGLTTTISTDYSSGPGNPRYNMHNTTLSPSVNTSNIWENDNSFLFLNGPGQANGEINIKHSYFQVNAGATATQTEAFEASMLNSGTVGTYDSYLGLMNNTSTGVVTNTLQQITLGLQNDNVTVGSIPKYVAITCQPMTGAGSAPTTRICLSNNDSAASILSLGNIGIGSLTPPGSSTLFQIQGPDALSTTFPISVKNNAAKTPFSVNDAGTVTVLANIVVGLSGSSPAGTISLLNATSGSLKLTAPNGALGTPILTLPALTDTVAVLGSNQTHTATQTFSGTLNASGVLQGNGVAGVTCAVGTLATATAVITNGIITHC